MRVYLIVLFSIISSLSITAQSSFEESKKAYQDGDYDKSISLLEADIQNGLKEGKASAELYYNLGNAYYKKNDLSKAILNYERALLLKPQDADIKHNIEFVNKKLEDKIEADNHSFIQIGFNFMADLFSSNTWSILSVFLFLLFLSSLILFIFSPKILLKKAGFYSSVTLLILLIFTNMFAYHQKKNLLDRQSAIVMSPIVNVMSTPSNTSNQLFILHEGTKVTIKNRDKNWIEIQLADGNKGWLEVSKVEII